MDLYPVFLGVFGTTLALLALTYLAGHRGLRALHLSGVALTLAALGATVVLAVLLGEVYDFDRTAQRVHRTCTTLFLVGLGGMAATGLAVLTGKDARRHHRRVAHAVAAVAVASSLTGFWMMSTRTEARTARNPTPAGHAPLLAAGPGPVADAAVAGHE